MNGLGGGLVRAFVRVNLVVCAALSSVSCSSSEGPGGRGFQAQGDAANAVASPPALAQSAREVAVRLNLDPHFLIGMGNDLPGAELNYDFSRAGIHTLPVTLDVHDVYLTGLKGQNGWPDWNANGTFVNVIADIDHGKHVVPMFTLYAMAAAGEGQLSVLMDANYMKAYWTGARLLFERLAAFDNPAIVHLEPDFWAFAQVKGGNDPAKIPAKVGSSLSDCMGLPESLSGMAQCLVKLARTVSPKVMIGFHASRWAAGNAADVVAFMTKLGAAEADLIVVETLDRDAGCFEAQLDPECTRDDGPWYWDEANLKLPHFHDHLEWVRALTAGLHRPALWWQLPFGVPSDTPGGSPGAFRDNRVRYVFSHVPEFVNAGGLGAVFGTGAGRQTYITSDGGQFKNAVTRYFASKTPLP